MSPPRVRTRDAIVCRARAYSSMSLVAAGESASRTIATAGGVSIAALEPHLALVGIDVDNAYPYFSRAEMQRGTIDYAPQQAPFLAALWEAPTRALLEVAPGVWIRLLVVDGTIQGATGSTPAFQRGLRRRLAGRLLMRHCGILAFSLVHRIDICYAFF